jgi:hypothetical protein
MKFLSRSVIFMSLFYVIYIGIISGLPQSLRLRCYQQLAYFFGLVSWAVSLSSAFFAHICTYALQNLSATHDCHDLIRLHKAILLVFNGYDSYQS